MRNLYLLFLVGIFMLTPNLAFAETNTYFEESQNPAAVNAIEITGGYKFDFNGKNLDKGFYSIGYKGSLVKSEGTPFKFAKGIDLAAPVSEIGTGDKNSFAIKYENGTTTVNSGLFEANGVLPLNLAGFEKLNLRGNANVAADAKFETIQFSAGLESPPLRIPGFATTQYSNWIVLGVNANRQEATNNKVDDKISGLITYRVFLGKAFGWRKSADTSITAAKISETILKQAPKYSDALIIRDKVQAIPANKRNSLQQLFLDTIIEAESEEYWQTTVHDMAFGRADEITDQQTFSLYVENSGWCSFADKLGKHRLENLLTATLDYWPITTNDNILIRLRYENGYEYALPNEKKDQILLSANLKF